MLGLEEEGGGLLGFADDGVVAGGLALGVPMEWVDAMLKEQVYHLDAIVADGLPEKGIAIRIRRSDVVITNDTGPRHIAAALGVPVVTIFGPTDPAWTEIDFELEHKVRVDVFCGPCQKKRCPLDHRCMTQIRAETVFAKAAELVEIAARQKVGA